MPDEIYEYFEEYFYQKLSDYLRGAQRAQREYPFVHGGDESEALAQ